MGIHVDRICKVYGTIVLFMICNQWPYLLNRKGQSGKKTPMGPRASNVSAGCLYIEFWLTHLISHIIMLSFKTIEIGKKKKIENKNKKTTLLRRI